MLVKFNTRCHGTTPKKCGIFRPITISVTPFTMAGNSPSSKPQTDARDRDRGCRDKTAALVEAERSVLGGLMLDNERWDDVAGAWWRKISIPAHRRYLYGDGALAEKRRSYRPDYARGIALERLGPTGQRRRFRLSGRLSQKAYAKRRISVLMRTLCANAPWSAMIAVAHEIADAGYTIPQGVIATNCWIWRSRASSRSRKAGPTRRRRKASTDSRRYRGAY